MFIHLTAGKESPHRVGMALKMALIFTDTHNVLLYCDIKGIEAVVKNKEGIKQLIAKGVPYLLVQAVLKLQVSP